MPGEPRWLLVSKPLRRPFDDGSTVLVRDLVGGLPPHRRLSYFGDPDSPLRDAEGDEVIARAPMGHSPGLLAKAGVLTVLTAPSRRGQPLHFFFTPNRVTSTVLSGLRRVQPRRPMVQSIMSSHDAARHVPLLRPLDAVIVLSDHTARALVGGGLDRDRVHRVHPGVRGVANLDRRDARRDAERRRMIYAGDLDAGVADRLIAIGRALDEPELAKWQLVIACRPKAEDDRAQRHRLKEALAHAIAGGRVELHGTVDDLPAMLDTCSLQLFVADHVKRKVDLPLVVLEGLARGLGLVAVDFSPLDEIFLRARERGLEVGERALDTAELVRALVGVANNPDRLDRWAADARTLVAREFSIEAMARAYDALYCAVESR